MHPTVDFGRSSRPSESVLSAVGESVAPGGDQPPRPDLVPRPWLASWPPGVPAGWTYPAVAVQRLVDDAVRDVPDGPALVDDAHTMTWAELGAVVHDVARGLATRRPTRVVLDSTSGLAAAVIALATWRVGAVLEVVDPTEPLPSAMLAAVTPWRTTTSRRDRDDAATVSADGDDAVLVLADHRGSVASHRTEYVRADVGRLVRRHTGRSRFGPIVRRLSARVGRPGARRGPARLSDLVDQAGPARPGPADADAPALRLVTPEGVVTATQRQLVASAFQVRLWVPDVATGSEVVAAAVGWWEPGGLVFGLLLAALTAGTCRTSDADHLAGTVVGATLAFADPTTWRELSSRGGWRGALRRPRAGAVPGTDLRLAGVVVRPGADLLDQATGSRLVTVTEGARVRHFWQPDETVGPVLAQPVYGRLAGDPGALPLVDTVLTTHGGITWACGPQVPRPDEGHWTMLSATLPMDVVTGAVARPDAAAEPTNGTTWQPQSDPAPPTTAAPPPTRQDRP